MADRPIIFSAPMIRALLDGRKTQTRRVIKPQPEINAAGLWVWPPRNHLVGDVKVWARRLGGFCQTDDEGLAQFLSSRSCRLLPVPGDRLWVREQWSGEHVFSKIAPSKRKPLDLGEGNAAFPESIYYWADGGPTFGDWERPRPSIHMPRWASRLTLTVTDVRVQRLQDINEADAVAEGCDPYMPGHGCATEAEAMALRAEGYPYSRDYRSGFQALWNSIYGHDAWDANPWVCALTFDVHRGNIDE